MSAAVAARQQSGSAAHGAGASSNPGSRMGTHSPVDTKKPNPKTEGMSMLLVVVDVVVAAIACRSMMVSTALPFCFFFSFSLYRGFPAEFFSFLCIVRFC
jgi:hypothetical protein